MMILLKSFSVIISYVKTSLYTCRWGLKKLRTLVSCLVLCNLQRDSIEKKRPVGGTKKRDLLKVKRDLLRVRSQKASKKTKTANQRENNSRSEPYFRRPRPHIVCMISHIQPLWSDFESIPSEKLQFFIQTDF